MNRMKCPDCDVIVEGNDEEEMKKNLMDHARSAHGYKGDTIEEMFGAPRARITEQSR